MIIPLVEMYLKFFKLQTRGLSSSLNYRGMKYGLVMWRTEGGLEGTIVVSHWGNLCWISTLSLLWNAQFDSGYPSPLVHYLARGNKGGYRKNSPSIKPSTLCQGVLFV